MDMPNKVKYEECKDTGGEFIIVSYKDIPIAERRTKDGWFEGKKIKECFKVFYCEAHPVDYVWINQEKKKKL